MFYALQDSGSATRRTHPAVKVLLVPVRHEAARLEQIYSTCVRDGNLPPALLARAFTRQLKQAVPALIADGAIAEPLQVRRGAQQRLGCVRHEAPGGWAIRSSASTETSCGQTDPGDSWLACLRAYVVQRLDAGFQVE